MNQTSQPSKSGELTGQTPATLAMAACFIFLVFYFILETYFLSNEYYAHGAPYFALAFGAIVVGLLAFYVLKRIEPDRVDANLFGLLIGLGAALALYSLLPRLNAATDTGGIKSYEYVLGPDYIWHSSAEDAPDLDVYLEISEWWQQYEPGDRRAFDLRKGGLGFWQLNMSRIYTEQQAYYDCSGVISCITR